jgi:hypothetical protein
MSNSVRKTQRTNDNNANETKHYIILVVAIILGIAGTFVRFVEDSFLFTSIGNVLLIIGSVIAISTVFKIMK